MKAAGSLINSIVAGRADGLDDKVKKEINKAINSLGTMTEDENWQVRHAAVVIFKTISAKLRSKKKILNPLSYILGLSSK